MFSHSILNLEMVNLILLQCNLQRSFNLNLLKLLKFNEPFKIWNKGCDSNTSVI